MEVILLSAFQLVNLYKEILIRISTVNSWDGDDNLVVVSDAINSKRSRSCINAHKAVHVVVALLVIFGQVLHENLVMIVYKVGVRKADFLLSIVNLM